MDIPYPTKVRTKTVERNVTDSCPRCAAMAAKVCPPAWVARRSRPSRMAAAPTWVIAEPTNYHAVIREISVSRRAEREVRTSRRRSRAP
jgi:hypothetical protein